MKKSNLFVLMLTLTISTGAIADGADDELLARNRTLSEMKFNQSKLSIQAQMAKSYKEMNDAGFIVDSNGVPLGVGDMERLALEVRRRGGMQAATSGSTSDPFGGADSGARMPSGPSMFGDAGFPTDAPPVMAPKPAKEKEDVKPEKVEVVAKPNDREKAQGKHVLRLVEIRGHSATVFTNDGFMELVVGQKVYDQKLASIGADSVTFEGKEGRRVVRIDWTKSVRYLDE